MALATAAVDRGDGAAAPTRSLITSGILPSSASAHGKLMHHFSLVDMFGARARVSSHLGEALCMHLTFN